MRQVQASAGAALSAFQELPDPTAAPAPRSASPGARASTAKCWDQVPAHSRVLEVQPMKHYPTNQGCRFFYAGARNHILDIQRVAAGKMQLIH